MNLRTRVALFAFSTASVFAGDAGITPDETTPGGAKDAFPLSAKAAASAKDLLVPPPRNTGWILGGGISMRNYGEITFDTGPSSLSIPSFYQSSFTPVPGIGSAQGFSARTYDDGFVRPDARTPNTGRSTHYAYENSGQLGQDTLAYRATGGERREVERSTTSSGEHWTEDRDWEPSPYLKLSFLNELGNGWSAGPSVQFSFASLDGDRRGTNTINGREVRDTYDLSATDTYDTTGLNLPHQEPYVGAPNIVAPLLPVAPVNRVLSESLRSTDVAVWSDSIAESLDVDTWSISVGAQAAYRFPRRFYASFGAGLALNVASWEGKRSDRLWRSINDGVPELSSSNIARNSGSSILWGVYLESSAGYQITEEFSIEANLRYDLSEELSGDIGNSSFDVELGGLSVGLGANYTFW